jgi:beta-galactosidase
MPEDKYLDWHVPYAPGALTALGYRKGQVVARYAAQTAGAPASLRLKADVESLSANEEDVAPIEVDVLDATGNIVSRAENEIEFSVSGEGALAGVGNGDPTSHEANVAAQRKAFHGLSMVLVRAGKHPGVIHLEAQTIGLPPATISIPVVADVLSQSMH